MPRSKSLDPAIRITVTIPAPVARESISVARQAGVSLSAFVAGAVKECLIRIRAMRQEGE